MNKQRVNTFLILFVLIIFLVLCYNYFSIKTLSYENFIDTNVKILHKETSKFQDISIIEGDNEVKCLLLNDEIQLCTNNEKIYHELIVHFPAAYLTSLKKVLIIGGGDLMTLREVMKYNISRVDMIELDDAVINASLKHFTTSNISKYENDKRVNIHIGDASILIDNIPENIKYDLIIIDTTEDSNINTPVETKCFFRKCKKMLNSKGIMIKNGYTSEHMDNVIKMKKINIFNYLADLFNNIALYKINTPDYQENEEYKFIMCSDTYNINDPIVNNEIKNIKLFEYNTKKHYSYINSNNFSFNNL